MPLYRLLVLSLIMLEVGALVIMVPLFLSGTLHPSNLASRSTHAVLPMQNSSENALSSSIGVPQNCMVPVDVATHMGVPACPTPQPTTRLCIINLHMTLNATICPAAQSMATATPTPLP